MKLAIIGSRNLLPEINLSQRPELIISGGARGVDTMAREYAKKNNIELLEIFPDYNVNNRYSAPIIRNKEIVDQCDEVLAFWDGQSKGTQMVINYAKSKGKPVKVVMIKVNG